MCVRIAVLYPARRLSGHICVRIAVFYQARIVSRHIYMLGVSILSLFLPFFNYILECSDSVTIFVFDLKLQ